MYFCVNFWEEFHLYEEWNNEARKIIKEEESVGSFHYLFNLLKLKNTSSFLCRSSLNRKILDSWFLCFSRVMQTNSWTLWFVNFVLSKLSAPQGWGKFYIWRQFFKMPEPRIANCHYFPNQSSLHLEIVDRFFDSICFFMKWNDHN